MKNLKRFFLCTFIIVALIAAFAISAAAVTESVTNSDGSIRIEYDTDTFSMHIINVNSAKIDFFPVSQNEDKTLNYEFQNFMDQYKDSVKFVKCDYFSRLNQMAEQTFFYGYTALESVNFAANQRMRMRTTGMFEGCTSLKTVWFGDESNKKEGVADLSGVMNNTSDADVNNIFIANLFKGCSALEEVILPSGSTYSQLPASTFSGCTSLKAITIPSNFLLIEADAFVDCPIEVIYADEGSVGYAFAEENGLLPAPEPVSLWDSKPDASLAVRTGYLQTWNGSAAVNTNIAYEVHDMDPTDAYSYTLYLYIDKTVTAGDYASNTIITSALADSVSITKDSETKKHPFISSTSWGTTTLNKIVIGEGITGINREAFAWLKGVTTIELPESFKSIYGGAFRMMTSLSTVYVRGNVPEAGVIDLRSIEYMDLSGGYIFSNMSCAEAYKFNPEVEVVDTDNGCREMFRNNSSLVSLDLSMMSITALGPYAFQGCDALEEISLPASVATMKIGSANASFASPASLKAIYAPVGSYMHTYAMDNGYDTTHTADITDGTEVYGTLTFFPESGRVEVLRTKSGKDLYAKEHGAKVFFDAYRELITEVVFPLSFAKIRSDELFLNTPNLRSVCFAENQRFLDKTGSVFAGCTNLKTVYFGNEADMKIGVADFSNMNGENIVDRLSVFMNGLFTNCSAIERVILPSFVCVDASDENAKYNPVIYANTFSGCTSLKSVTITENFISIEDGAFESCTSLNKIIMKAPVSLIGNGTFAGGTKGTVIYCENLTDAEAVNAVLSEAGISSSSVFAFTAGGMSLDGYQVRESGYNGLRTLFVFDLSAREGYELVEFGALTSTKDKWSSFSESFGGEGSVLTLSGTEFVTADSKIIKKAIMENGEYTELNYKKSGNTVTFNVTVVKFDGQDQYKTEIVSVGYEIWKKGNEHFVIFTGEEASEYDSMSLYKLSLAMLQNKKITLKKDAQDPTWNMLLGCDKTELNVDNDAVTGMLVSDPVNSGKYIAIYATDSASAQAISNLGISDMSAVSTKIFGKNVEYAVPVIDDYWAAHIDEKLATLPEGRSFIIYTDTHYLSVGGKNTRITADLIEYVRANSGIKTVVNLGDPYSKEDTKEQAEQIFREALETDFYDRFGEDGLFVVGNHDANYTRWGKLKDSGAVEGVDGQGAYTVLLPDTTIYDATIKHIENKEGIAFDLDMLALADGKGEDDIVFTAKGNYSAEQMKAEFVAWAKQHYYYDDHENGIRYIVYNSGNCGLTEYYVLNKLYSKVIPTQLKFIADALLSTPNVDGKDYDVVFLGHMLGSNEDYNTAYEEVYKLLSAFKAGSSYTLTYDMSGNDAMDAVVGFENEYTVNFDAYNGTVFSLSGHWHLDLSYVYQTVGASYVCNIPYEDYNYISDDAVFYIGLNNDCYNDPIIYDSDITMEKDTVSENCISIITIKADGEIVLTRIGAGSDRIFSYN